MKQILILTAVLLSSVSSAAAVECAAELPAARTGHWSYRLIEGRKCWYEGKAMLPKSALRWPDKSPPDAQVKSPPDADARSLPDAKARPLPQAKPAPMAKSLPAAPVKPLADDPAKMPATDGRDFSDPEDGSCCWPPPGDDNSFESRWRSLGLKPAS
jgi:hypothetical protein